MRKIVLAILAFTLLLFGVTGTAMASDAPALPTETHTTVEDPLDIPAGAVEIASAPGQACTTNYNWVLVTPGTAEVSHEENRFYLDVPAYPEISHYTYGLEERTRTYTPGTDEVSHQVYSYKKLVQDTKTEYRYHYQKKVKGNVQTLKKNSWSNTGTFDYEWFQSPTWNGGPLSHWGAWGYTADTEQTGPHNSTSNTYNNGANRKVSTTYTYFKDGQSETRQVPDGSHYEYSGEITTTLDAPWVLLDGYPKTVVDAPATEESYGDWSNWETLIDGQLDQPALPANTSTHEYRESTPVKVIDWEASDGYRLYYAEGSNGVLNIEDASWVTDTAIEGWTLLDSRTVVDKAAVPTNSDYYTWNDGNVCGTVDVPPSKPPVTPAPPAAVPTVINSGI